MTSLKVGSALVVLCVATACDSPAAPVAEEPVVVARPASPKLGNVAFLDECASCHASRDGFDLAFFSFPDSTIMRRALGHVDEATAFDITAYINTLSVAPVARHDQTFQPGGLELTNDVEFARNLFGSDAWPSDLSTAGLSAMDPRDVPVALTFPRWSSEETNLDWMPDARFPEVLLTRSNHWAGSAVRQYQESGTGLDLYRAAQRLRWAERNPVNNAAPCQLGEEARFRPNECFQARRWTASLVAQHMLRSGSSEPMHFALHDTWWDVGNVARKSLVHGRPIPNAEQNWAVWMYLGWAFAPQRHASTYLSSALVRLDLPRHATFHALRAQVARVEGTGDAYKDLFTTVRVAPRGWLVDAARFSLRNLIERLEAGDQPSAKPFENVAEGSPVSQRAKAWEGLETARRRMLSRLDWDEWVVLEPLYQRVWELLPR
ncbi:MAG: hypothetical protein VX815_07055 [Gemmatimonadota bacterium]|nr:hypothetical protein [Gemmatimonadota bacterium]